MSETKKPENLLAEIWYSSKCVHASYYKDGKFTHGDEYASFPNVGLTEKRVEEIVVGAIRKLLNEHLCGFVVDPSLGQNDDTMIRVYQISLPLHADWAPLWFDTSGISAFDSWLGDFFETYQVKRARTEVHASTGYEPPSSKPFAMPKYRSPVQEVEAVLKALHGGDITRREACAKFGRDVEEVDAEIAADKAKHQQMADLRQSNGGGAVSTFEEYKLRLLRAQALKAEIEVANAITESRLDDHDLDYLVKKVRNGLKSLETLA